MLHRRARKNTVPILVLAGFLGSGKTTILNTVLRAAIGAKIAVIVNDFGDVNIDSLLISARTDSKMELTNGCLCCSIGDGEFEETLESILTGSHRPDAIIIEASGLAEPEDMARLILMSRNKSVAYGGLAYVVDAAHYDEIRQKHPALSRHVGAADLVILTKTEQVSADDALHLKASLSKLTTAPIVTAEHGNVAPALLFDIPARPEVQLSLLQQEEHAHHHHHHLHDAYQSATFETIEPLAPEKFKAFMDNLPKGIYRAKGIAYFGINGYEQKFIIQAVGRRWDMYAEAWQADEEPRTVLVLIGTQFDIAATLAALQQAIGDSACMLDMRRYAT